MKLFACSPPMRASVAATGTAFGQHASSEEAFASRPRRSGIYSRYSIKSVLPSLR